MDELAEYDSPVKEKCENRVSAGGVLQSEAEKKKKAARREKDARAFGRLGVEIVRSRDINEFTLAGIAYRSTFADNLAKYGLSRAICNRTRKGGPQPIFSKGFGRYRFDAFLKDATQKGLLQRDKRHRGSDGKWSPAKDRLTLPKGSEQITFGRLALFSGKFTPAEVAVALYVRAGTGKGPRVYAREVAERFGWSRKKAGDVLRSASEKGLTSSRNERENGRFKGRTYQASAALNVTLTEHGAYRTRESQSTAKQKTYIGKTPSHSQSPSRSEEPLTYSAARHVDLQQSERTDGASGSLTAGEHATLPADSGVGFPMGTSGELPHFSKGVRTTLCGYGVDVDALIESYVDYVKKKKGKVIEDPDAYLLAMGEEEAEKQLGVPKGVLKNISSQNRALRATAYGRVMGASAEPSRDVVDDVCRLAAKYGLNAQEQIQLWRTQREGRPASNPDASLRSFFYSAMTHARENARRAQST